MNRKINGLVYRLARILDASADAIFSFTPDGILTSWNRGAEAIFGYSKREAVGQVITDIIRAPDSDDQAEFLAMLRSKAPHSLERSEVTRLHRSGRPVVLSIVGSALHNVEGRVMALAAVARDITGARARDAQLVEINERLVLRELQLQALTDRLFEVREEERRRISRDVHDGLGQLLTAIKLEIGLLGRGLSAGRLATAVATARLDEISGLVGQTIESVQRIAVDLRPSALDALGLGPAVHDEALRFQKRTGVQVSLQVDIPDRPAREVETTLFRIFQESMTNVARHAHASTVSITLGHDAAGWLLLVRDDGVGFVPRAAHRQTPGLLGMQERARNLRGTVIVESAPGAGTKVIVRIPIEPAPHGPPDSDVQKETVESK